VRWREILKPQELKKQFAPDLYQRFLAEELLSGHARTIMKDIDRTFPQHRLFNLPYQGKEKLFHILKAYSIYDIDVGYSQGLAFLAGFLLLHIDEEEEVFWCLVRIMSDEFYNLRAIYKTSECYILKLLLKHFEILLKHFRPQIATYLEEQGIDASMYAPQWFCTLFSYRFHHNFSAEVWNRFLRYGFITLFQISLSIIDHLKDKILELPFEQLVPFLSHPPEDLSLDVVSRSGQIIISHQMVYFLFNIETSSSNR